MKVIKNVKIYFMMFMILFVGLTSCDDNEPFENCPEITIDIDNVPGSAVYRFAAEIDDIDDVRLSWSIDGKEVSTGSLDNIASEILDYQFESGSHTVCVKIASDTCPAQVCKEIEVIRDQTDPCPDLFFTAREYERSNTYKFIGNFKEKDSIRYTWSINGVVVTDSATNGNYLIRQFKEAGSYEVCLATETPECPEGVKYCKVIEIDETQEDCEEVAFARDGDYLYEQSGKSRRYIWSIDGEVIDDPRIVLNEGRKFSLDSLVSGTYKICITAITENCQDGVAFCKEVKIEKGSRCPQLSFIVDREGESNAYNFIADFEGKDTISYLGWFVNDMLVQESTSGNHEQFYYQFDPGSYEVCLATETPECPEGTKFCKVIKIEEQKACPDLKYTRDGNFLFADFEGIDTLRWYGWIVNGDPVEDEGTMNQGDNKLSLENFGPGNYEICLFTETPDCPRGTSFCTNVIIE